MVDDEEGMNNALEYYTDNKSYWGDWTDEDPYTNVDSAEEMEEEDEYDWDEYDDYDVEWDEGDYDDE